MEYDSGSRVVKRIDFIRAGWCDRLFKNVDTSDILYFCELPFKWLGTNAYFHRHGKGGPLLMTVSRKPFSSGATFQFANETEVKLEPRGYFGLSRNSYFQYKSRRFKWNGTGKLKSEFGELLAKFDRDHFAIGKDGRLEIYKRGEDMVDIIVATLMMVLYRMHDEESSRGYY